MGYIRAGELLDIAQKKNFALSIGELLKQVDDLGLQFPADQMCKLSGLIENQLGVGRQGLVIFSASAGANDSEAFVAGDFV
jgi:hypothetical protein